MNPLLTAAQEGIQMVEEQKHTPGPWTDESPDESQWGVYALDGTPIAQAQQLVGDTIKQHKRTANTRLIAAAPDLKEALRRLCKSFPTDTDMLAAGWEPLEIEEACTAYDVARAALSKAGA